MRQKRPELLQYVLDVIIQSTDESKKSMLILFVYRCGIAQEKIWRKSSRRRFSDIIVFLRVSGTFHAFVERDIYSGQKSVFNLITYSMA